MDSLQKVKVKFDAFVRGGAAEAEALFSNLCPAHYGYARKRYPRPADARESGGAAEAEELFANEGQPVHSLSTRFEGVNYLGMQSEFDAFVEGEAAEAEELFANEGQPVHCLSTRFEGVNYRVSMLIGVASELEKGYMTTYNPNYYNQFTLEVDGEDAEARKSRTNGRSLLSFVKALEHTQRTKGCLIQVGC